MSDHFRQNLYVRTAVFVAVMGIARADAAPDLIGDASVSLNYALTWGGCKETNRAEAEAALARTRACSTTSRDSNISELANIGHFEKSRAEGSFFSQIAKQHATELNCASATAYLIAKNQEASSDGVVQKLNVMRDARRAWLEAVSALRSDRTLSGRSCPSTLDELNDDHENPTFTVICRKLVRARTIYAVVENSIPLIGERSVRNFAERFANQTETILDLTPDVSDLFKEVGSKLKAQASILNDRAKTAHDNEFSAEEKHSLLEDPAIINSIVSSDAITLGPVACRAEARFGRGRDHLMTTLGISSFALGGAALAVRGIATVAKASRILLSARAAGTITSGTFRLLQAGAISASVATVAIEATQACATSSWTSKAHPGACVSAPTLQQIHNDNCALSRTLVALDAAAILPAGSVGAMLIPLRITREAVVGDKSAASVLHATASLQSAEVAESAGSTLAFHGHAKPSLAVDNTIATVRSGSGKMVSQAKLDDALAQAERIDRVLRAERRIEIAPELLIHLSSEQRQRLAGAIEKLQEFGPEGTAIAENSLQKINKLIESGTRTPVQAVENFTDKIFLDRLKQLEAIAAKPIEIKTVPFSSVAANFNRVEEGVNMKAIEQNFDVLARKASAPDHRDTLHEVDTAFSSHGLPDRKVSVSGSGKLLVPGVLGERVLAVGSQGALSFAGKKSNHGGERFYAAIFPKGFIAHFGKDIRFTGPNGKTGNIPSREEFRSSVATQGKVFIVRAETATEKTGGQVHVQNTPEYRHINIDGRDISPIEWLRQQAVGVVEFDESGRIIKVRKLK